MPAAGAAVSAAGDAMPAAGGGAAMPAAGVAVSAAGAAAAQPSRIPLSEGKASCTLPE